MMPCMHCADVSRSHPWPNPFSLSRQARDILHPLQTIKLAYDILSDSSRRKHYDRFGSGLRGAPGGAGMPISNPLACRACTNVHPGGSSQLMHSTSAA